MTAAQLSAHMTGMETLASAPAAQTDVNTRLATAQDPSTDSQALWQLIDDHNDLVANTARQRLGLTQRLTFEPHIVHIPVIDPASGRIVQ